MSESSSFAQLGLAGTHADNSGRDGIRAVVTDSTTYLQLFDALTPQVRNTTLNNNQQNGLNFVTDASYPDVSPGFQGTVEYLKKQALAKAESANKMAKAASDAAVPGFPAVTVSAGTPVAPVSLYAEQLAERQ